MSAENYYQPHVTIAGEKIGESAKLIGPTAIARLSIDWGSEDWFSDVDAAILNITVLDPRPDYGLTAAALRSAIVVTRDPDNTTVFLGNVIEATSRIVKVTSPKTGKPYRTYAHSLTCTDPLGALQRDRRRGRIYNNREGEEKVAHWGPCTMGERKRDLQGRISQTVMFGPSPLDQYDSYSTEPYVYTWPVVPYERQAVVSVLTVLRRTVRIGRPLARPYFDPATDSVIPVEPPLPEPGFTLWRGSTMYGLTTQYTQIIDGNNIRLEEDAEVSTTMLEQVTQVELKLQAARPNQIVTSANSTDGSKQRLEWVDQPESFELLPNAAAQMTVSVDSDHSWAYFDSATQHFVKLSAQIASAYGLPKMPDIRYKFAKHEAAPEWASRWLNPAPPLNTTGSHIVYQPINAITNEFANMGPFSVPGGTLTYSPDKGWEALLKPATVGYSPSELTLSSLNAGTADPRLDQCNSATITVADLQHAYAVS